MSPFKFQHNNNSEARSHVRAHNQKRGIMKWLSQFKTLLRVQILATREQDHLPYDPSVHKG
jgi:hypothetical protein